MTEELKSCPFCGGKSQFSRVKYPEHQDPIAWFADGSPAIVAHYVNCQMCGANNRGIAGGYQTQTQAAEKWNTRAGEKM